MEQKKKKKKKKNPGDPNIGEGPGVPRQAAIVLDCSCIAPRPARSIPWCARLRQEETSSKLEPHKQNSIYCSTRQAYFMYAGMGVWVEVGVGALDL